MKKRKLSPELKNGILWLERQPGVTNVVIGSMRGSGGAGGSARTTGSTAILATSNKTVDIRIYDKKMLVEVTVHAAQSPARDRWVAALAGGKSIDDLIANQPARIVAIAKPKAPPNVEAIEVAKTMGIVPDSKAAAQWFDVTPELAQRWLEHNTRNRKLRDNVVDRYAQDMREGRWLPSGDAIQFDTNGAIINGQHRLWAVFTSGTTVRMMVAFDMDPDTVSVLDDHLKRNLVDVVGITRPGSAVNSYHAAVANILLLSRIWNTSVDQHKAQARISRQAQLEMLQKHWDAIEFAIRDCFRSAHVRAITVAGVMGPMARAYYTQDRERLRQFAKVMATGVPEGPNDNAALMFRNVLINAGHANTRIVASVVYRKTERTLQAFLEGRSLQRVDEQKSGELFPLPEEKGRRK